MEKSAEIFDEIVNRRRSYRLFDTVFGIPDDVVKRSLHRATLAPNSSNMQLWEFYRIKSKGAKDKAAKICMGQSGAVTAAEIVVFIARPDLWKERRQAHLNRIGNNKAATVADETRLLKSSDINYYKYLMRHFYDPAFGLIKDFVKFFVVNIRAIKSPYMRDVYSKDIPVVVHKSTALAAQTFMLSIVAEGYDCLPMEGFDSKRMKKLLKLPSGAQINMAVAIGKGLEKGLRGPRFRIPDSEVIFEI